jgi:hypothetical protein
MNAKSESKFIWIDDLLKGEWGRRQNVYFSVND